ncbi:PREDICTED: fibropellin-1-like [Amphimedon queenslandica]|uniref:EGF-like domain-containing protein n=1 Tax=Amphimedon queenslandica TaxID=400682 RepID=A0A1X7UB57_AMPQE|nr:PREDICTED: fibropellin-1-like [Amphimedon queenslandica]|eukprot:XP_019855208.1 PREDICTED: fibropellin-1-like [Amphimedon queenslandica]
MTSLLFSLLFLLFSSSVRGQCSNITMPMVLSIVNQNYPVGEGGSANTSINHWYVTCTASGGSFGTFSSSSIIANVTVHVPDLGIDLVALDTSCSSGEWILSGSLAFPSDTQFAARLNATQRVNCRRCRLGISNYDPLTNCVDCYQDCSVGTTYCTNSGCCPYYSIDTNSCTNECGSNQHPNSSTFICQCDEFYTGSDCSNCSIVCQNGGVRNSTSCSCTCTSGYTGATCTEDINECTTSPSPVCRNGGSCSNTAGGYECVCALGYTGPDCVINIDDCDPDPCVNGTCSDGINGYTCSCAAGFTGKNCDVNINECDGNPCNNGGTCTDGINRYICTCTSQYNGTTCDDDVNECQTNPPYGPCLNGGSCDNEVGGFSCRCEGPWTGGLCDQCTIGENCVTGDCDPTSFTCTQCEDQYSLVNGTCVSCSVKDCTSCTYKDNCTSCANSLVPSDEGRICSPPIVVSPPTREPGRGSGLNTGAIIGIIAAFLIILIIIAIIIAVVIVVLAKVNKEKPPTYKVKTQNDPDKEIILTKISNI